jgi:hypothetical protein
MQKLASRYNTAVRSNDRFWSRRAALRTAILYDDFYRRALEVPDGYRGTALPPPLSVGRVDSRAVVAGVLGGAWPAEISRLYSELIASVDGREPDPILLERARDRAAAFARLALPEGESAENPWLADDKPGLLRYHRRFEKKGDDGRWRPLEAAAARPLLAAALAQGPGTIEHAYALVASADGGPAPGADAILAALKHGDARVVLAGLLAAEKAPSPALFDALVEIAARPQKGAPFATLQDSLFGTRERALLALRALAQKDREIAAKLIEDEKVPARERVWIVAELGEARLEHALQNLSRDRDPNVAATALYALFLARGKNVLGHMRPNEPGVVGCVSKAVMEFAGPG